MEEWKIIEVFPKYSVSNLGRIRKDAAKSSRVELIVEKGRKPRRRTRYLSNKERIFKKRRWVMLWEHGIYFLQNADKLRDQYFN